MNNIEIDKLENIYKKIKKNIKIRILDFKNIWENGNDEDIFLELVFCIFTPQSKARNCWKTVNTLKEKELLYSASGKEMSKFMNLVRFRNNKAEYLILARNLFLFEGKLIIKEKIMELLKDKDERDWFIKNIKGLGYKESSHFLRNIGANLNYAILDRHILKNLNKLGVIEEIPKNLSKNKYLDIEKRMKKFAKKINIPISHLDILFWYNETGEIFK